MNVYTRELPQKWNKFSLSVPVLVYIHPGGFYSLSGQSKNYAGPKNLMDRKIVLVTVNYRLGALGFMSTGTRECPGNAGLKDQVMALKWIQRNIHKFGGNPESVTIMGYSAGAMSVTLHMVSPMSNGLFHKVIAMSGAATSQWRVPTDQFELAQKQARLLQCPDDTSENIINCLRKVSAKQIGDSLPAMFDFDYNPIILWEPVVEKKFGQARFLTDNPTKLFREGNFIRTPVLAGITKDEFVYPAISILSNDTLSRELSEHFNELAPILFLYEDNENKSISTRLRTEFLNEPLSINHSLVGLNQVIEYYSRINFMHKIYNQS